MTIPRDRNGNIIPDSDWEMILTALTGLPPRAAIDVMVTAEARRIERTENRNAHSSAAGNRRKFEQIKDGLRRDGLLTGDPAKDTALIFERERKRDTTRKLTDQELADLEAEETKQRAEALAAAVKRQEDQDRRRESVRKARLVVLERQRAAVS